jgi:hypothetical protein
MGGRNSRFMNIGNLGGQQNVLEKVTFDQLEDRKSGRAA